MERLYLLGAMATVASGCGFDYCDIRKSDCQNNIFYEVLRLRGEPWDAWAEPPPVEVITQEQYRQRLSPTQDTNQENPWNPGLKLLGLLDPDADIVSADIESRVQNVVAYYSSGRKRVTIVDHGDAGDVVQKSLTLAHEFVHAIQDRYHGLEKLYGEYQSADQQFGRRTIIEGEAVLYEDLLSLRARGKASSAVNWDSFFQTWRGNLDAYMVESPARLTEALRRYVYPLGGLLMAKAHLAGGNPEVQTLVRNPHDSSIATMLSYGRPKPSLGALPCHAPPAPPRFEVADHDVIGALGVYVFLLDGSDAEDAWSRALGWRSGRIWVYRDENEDQTIVLWMTQWASSTQAEDFREPVANSTLAANWVVERIEDRVVVAATDAEGLFDAFDATICGQ